MADFLGADPHHERGAAQVLGWAIKHGLIDLFTIDYKKASQRADEMADSTNERVQAAGVRLQAIFASHNLKVIEMLGGKDTAPVVNVNVAVPVKVEFDRGG